MSYQNRLDHAFADAPVLPITPHTQYDFFSDCHRGTGSNNDNFLKNTNSYFAALQYYYQYGFCYIEVGDGDELWENSCMSRIMETHTDVFDQLCQFHRSGRMYMLYGNHDMIKKNRRAVEQVCRDLQASDQILNVHAVCRNHFLEELPIYEGLVFQSEHLPRKLCVTHGHQADFFNSVLWRLAGFLVRYLWSPLEALGILDPTSAAKNNTKQKKLEKRYIEYAIENNCLLLTGHTHRPTLCNEHPLYCNCGSCVHPRCITCIELCGYQMNLVKWYCSTQKNGHFGNIYAQCPPSFPVYIKREVLISKNLLS